MSGLKYLVAVGMLLSASATAADLAEGQPRLSNEKVAFVWSRGEEGAGLVSIHDREMGREFLRGGASRATLWEVEVKKRGGGEGRYSNVGMACAVTAKASGLELVWEGGVRVRVVAKLGRDEMQARMRIRVEALAKDEGLVSVTFPVVEGIAPITGDGEGDKVLAFDSCRMEASPSRSGKEVVHRWPLALQFSALLAEGVGLYVAEEDPTASEKRLTWSPGTEERMLSFTVPHLVLGWGGPQLVKQYVSPGDVVIGPFHGDWYDAARLYRKWALAAPWCAKGPIYVREGVGRKQKTEDLTPGAGRGDFPGWLGEASYWTLSHVGFEEGIEEEIEKHEAFGLPLGVCHDYGYWCLPGQDDRYPDYFPPRLGSRGLTEAVERLHRVGMKVVPYVNGSLWDQDTESWEAEDAQQGAVRAASGEMVVWTYFEQPLVFMCPGSGLWRRKLLDISKELVGRYDMDGVYFDYLTTVPSDCYSADHGHAISGGDVWIRSIRELYSEVRRELKEIKPEAMVTGENIAEWVIDLLDTALYVDASIGDAPMFQAVYHGYTLTYGAITNNYEPYNLGRTWLRGSQNGWSNTEILMVYALKGEPISGSMEKSREVLPCAVYYRKLLRCHHDFGKPYLVYGEMLRPPRIEGDVPAIDTAPRWQLSPVPAVEGSAWRAPDGSVGIFLTSYDKEKAREVTWSVDLEEGAGWDAETRVRLSSWTEEEGLKPVGEVEGGKLTRVATVEALGLIALRLEVIE